MSGGESGWTILGDSSIHTMIVNDNEIDMTRDLQ